MKCRHPKLSRREVLAFDLGHAHVIAGPADRIVAIMCDCGQPMELGPANDTQDVLVEVRAAELSHLATSHADHMESAGWSAVTYDGTPLDDPRWHAGWLGRVIFDERRASRTDTSLPADLMPDAVALAMRAPRIR